MQTTYGRSPYFKKYSTDLEVIYNGNYSSIGDLCSILIKKIGEFLGLKTRFIKSSELDKIESKSTQALIDLCRLVNADTFIAGATGINYIDMDLWHSSGLKIIFQKYTHPVYKQFNNQNFQSHMCILDLLFNYGDESLNILVGK